MQYFFDLNGICCLKLWGEPFLLEKIKNEFQYYRIERNTLSLPVELEVELNSISYYKPLLTPSHLAPFDFHTRYKLAKWVIRFDRIQHFPFRLRFYGNFFSSMIVTKWIVEPAIRWLAQRLGLIFCHSTSLVKNKKAFLLSAEGGIGKTSILLKWLERGNPFLSDDFTIISYKQVMGYNSPLRLGARMLLNSSALRGLSVKRRMEIVLRTIFRNLLLNYARVQAKVPIGEIVPNIEIITEAGLVAVGIMEHSQGEFKLEEVPFSYVVDRLTEINKREMSAFSSYLDEIGKRTSDKELQNFWRYHYERLLDYISSVQCFLIKLPKNPAKRVVEEFFKEVETILA